MWIWYSVGNKSGQEKISLFSNVLVDSVVVVVDVGCIYELPLALNAEGLDDQICERLNIWSRRPDLAQWHRVVERFKNPQRGSTVIGIVGKYVHLRDSYKSLHESLVHAAIAQDCKLELRYIDSEDYRRRIGTQINKGEALHALRNYLFFANEGKVRRRHQEEQANQASCLNLVVNAIVTWNTVYMNEVISRLRREGIAVNDADVAHLSPARYGHINPYGKYRFDIDAALDPTVLRPLRDPEDR